VDVKVPTFRKLPFECSTTIALSLTIGVNSEDLCALQAHVRLTTANGD
jgi:hypothetical protein